MKKSAKAKLAILGSSITALTVVLVACGGGGTSSGAGAGGSGIASVSGTVNGGSANAIDIRPGVGPAQLLATLGDIVISVAHAAGIPGVNVVVSCPGVLPYSGVTDGEGKFKILTPEVAASTVCTTTFDGASGPEVSISPGMETEIEVTLAGGAVNLVRMQQRVDSRSELEIEVEDGTRDDGISDGVASNDDDDSSSLDDDDSSSIDQVDADDQSSDDTGRGTGTG